MSIELNSRSLSVTAAAKLLKVPPKTVRARIRRGLALVAPASPDGLRRAGERIDLIVYRAWLNQQALGAPEREANRQTDGA